MKFLLLSFNIICFFNAALSQVTFNRIYQFDYSAAVLTSVIETSNGYDAIGIYVDTFPYNRENNIYVKFDFEGNISSQTILADSTKSYELWEASLEQTINGETASVGYSTGETWKAILIRYNEFGDTVSVIEYTNPFYPEESFILPRDLIQTNNNGYVSLNSVEVPSTSSTGIQLVKFNSQCMIEWQRIYDSDAWERQKEIKQDDDGGYLLGAWRTNFNVDNNNFQCQDWLIKTDSIGQMEWEWLSPLSAGLRGGIIGLEKQTDGGYIIASGEGHEHPINGSNSLYWNEGLFYKLNEDGTIEWERPIRGGFPRGENDRFTRMTSCSDGSGFVACGTKVDTFTTEDVFETGTFGWLSKISPDGDSLWSRYYSYIRPAYAHSQAFFDLKETSDGGFIMAGEAKDPLNMTGYPQSGWLLKVDQYGCLVPGCHLINSNSDPENDFDLLLYPNPASDFINIFYRRNSVPSGPYYFSIINAIGQEMLRFSPTQSEVTHMVPVRNYPIGVYYVQYWEDGILVKTEEVVISH